MENKCNVGKDHAHEGVLNPNGAKEIKDVQESDRKLKKDFAKKVIEFAFNGRKPGVRLKK